MVIVHKITLCAFVPRRGDGRLFKISGQFCSSAVCTGSFRKIGRIVKHQKVKVAYKPQQIINSLSLRPKERDDSDRQKSGVVYKINCTHAKKLSRLTNNKKASPPVVDKEK